MNTLQRVIENDQALIFPNHNKFASSGSRNSLGKYTFSHNELRLLNNIAVEAPITISNTAIKKNTHAIHKHGELENEKNILSFSFSFLDIDQRNALSQFNSREIQTREKAISREETSSRLFVWLAAEELRISLLRCWSRNGPYFSPKSVIFCANLLLPANTS